MVKAEELYCFGIPISLNPAEMWLLEDLKEAIHARKPTNIPEIKLFCKQEWTKIPSS